MVEAGDHMILPAAASLLLLTQAPASAATRADAGGATARLSSLPVEPAPGLPRVLVSGVPQVPPDFEAWLAPYTEVRSAVLADPGDDAKTVLILTRFSSVNQIHRVTAPLGDREQLTFGKEPVAKARWLPGDSRTVFFLQDVGGGESFQLYRLDTRTGQRQVLTDGKSRHETFTAVTGRPAPGLLRHRPQRDGHGRLPGGGGEPEHGAAADRGSRNLVSGGVLAGRRGAAGEADEGHRRLGPLGRGSEDEGARHA